MSAAWPFLAKRQCKNNENLGYARKKKQISQKTAKIFVFDLCAIGFPITFV